MPKKRKQRVIVPHQMTRGQLSRHQREVRRQRYLYYAMAGVGGLILLVFAVVALDQLLIKPAQLGESLKQVVATVGDQQITRETYNKQRSWELYNQALYASQLQAQGIDPSQLGSFGDPTTLSQDLRNVATAAVDPNTLQTLADNVLIQQRAASIGVTLTDAEFRAAALKDFEPQPTPIPETPSPTPTATATPATPLPPATNTPSTPQPPATATATRTNTPGPSPTLTTTPTASNTPLPVPGAEGTATVQYNNFLTSLKKGPAADANDGYCQNGCPGLSEQDYLDLVIKPQTLRTRVTEKLQADVPTTQEQVNVAHILFATQADVNPTRTPYTDAEAQQEAQKALTRATAGEDFAKLAAELSDDASNKDQGGDLGFFLPTEKGGSMVQPFSDAAFKLTKPGELALVQTDFGWHVIKLIAREQRPLDVNAYQTARNQAFDDWLAEQKTQVVVDLKGLGPTPVPPTAPPLPTEPPPPPVTNPPITDTNPVTP